MSSAPLLGDPYRDTDGLQRPARRGAPRDASKVFDAGVSNVAVMEPPQVEGELFSPKAHCELDESEKMCGGRFHIVERGDRIWTLKCDGCLEEVGYPAWRNDPARVMAHRLEHSGIPEFYVGRAFDSEDPGQKDALKACREWIRHFRSDPLPAPALWGDVGRGKTHLLCMTAEALIRAYGVRVIYRSAVAMFDELRSAMHEESYDVRWERLLECDVLVLDDLSADKGSDWERERLSALADHRYSRQLPVVFATNALPRGWEAAFGERAASRLRGMTMAVRLTGPDHRYRGEQTRLA